MTTAQHLGIALEAAVQQRFGKDVKAIDVAILRPKEKRMKSAYEIEKAIIADTVKHPRMARGQVWCTKCGATIKVDSAKCMKRGWPTCCGYTMTIDSPEERKAHQ